MSFGDMIATLFADPVLTRDAVYQPQTGGSFVLRVMTRQPDVITGFGDSQLHSPASLFDVQSKDVVQPAVGDRLTVDGVAYIIQSEPVADRERLVWTLNMRPA